MVAGDHGSMFALAGAEGGPVVHRLLVDDDDRVQLGPRLETVAGLGTIAIGRQGSVPVVLGSAVRTGVPVVDTGAALLEDLLEDVDGILADEPDGPLDVATPHRLVSTVDDFAGVARPSVAHGLLTAVLGPWSVHQHGLDEEADHLSMLTVRHHERELLAVDDLGQAAVAQLGGEEVAPVVAVADGTGRLRVLLPATRHEAPPLEDLPTSAVVGSADGPIATRSDARGRLVVSRLRDGRWEPDHTVDGVRGPTDVLPVAGEAAVLAADAAGVHLVRVGGGR